MDNRLKVIRARIAEFECPATVLIVLCAAFVVLASNRALYGAVSSRLDVGSLQGLAFVVSLYLLLICVMSLVFFLTGHKYTIKPVLIGFLMLSATLGYFSQQLGVIF